MHKGSAALTFLSFVSLDHTNISVLWSSQLRVQTQKAPKLGGKQASAPSQPVDPLMMVPYCLCFRPTLD